MKFKEKHLVLCKLLACLGDCFQAFLSLLDAKWYMVLNSTLGHRLKQACAGQMLLLKHG